MSDTGTRALVDLRMRQAQEVLTDAQIVRAGNGSGRTVVNRAYYAAFYAVLALLQIVGRSPRRHHGAILLFDEYYVQTALFPQESLRNLRLLFEQRQEDDYRRTDPVAREDAELALQRAERFCETVRQYLTTKDMLSQ
jgi:uncharacterized protein (UPF0332 family)